MSYPQECLMQTKDAVDLIEIHCEFAHKRIAALLATGLSQKTIALK